MTKPTLSTAAILISLILPAMAVAHKEFRHHHHRVQAARHTHRVTTHSAPNTQEILALALADAEQYWGGTPPCGGLVIFRVVPEGIKEYLSPSEGYGGWETLGMWSEWSDWGTYAVPPWETELTGIKYEYNNYADEEGEQFNPLAFTECTITYTSRAWPNTESMLRYWPILAHDVAHEVQHFQNRWYLETPIDHGTVPLAALRPDEVAYPLFTGLNEPWTAKAYRPIGAVETCCLGH